MKSGEQKKSGMTYQASGVDIAVADKAKVEMAKALETDSPRVLNRVGAFASLIDGRFAGINHPVLVLKMEEPGSKQLLAAQHGRLADIGYDLVNHLVNDVVVMGAAPIAVLDTIICGKLEKDQVLRLVRSMADACRALGCDLVGGETSEQPRVIPEGAYILSASALGVVDREKVVDGSKITPGDVVLAVASNGLHTNGYTFVRSLLDADPSLASSRVGDVSFIDAVLRPHVCYSPALQEIFRAVTVHGLAHITGGGIRDNLVRILREGRQARIDLSRIEIPPVFRMLRDAGQAEDDEMIRSFNLGAGLVCVAPAASVEQVVEIFARHGQRAYQIGTIIEGTRSVEFEERLRW